MEENRYELQIRSNTFKRADEINGNGLYKDYAEQRIKFDDNKTVCYVLVYPYSGNFYLEAGRHEHERKLVDKVRVEGTDLYSYEIDPNIFIKYANILLDRYVANVEANINQK